MFFLALPACREKDKEWKTFDTTATPYGEALAATMSLPEGWKMEYINNDGSIMFVALDSSVFNPGFARVLTLYVEKQPGISEKASGFDDEDWKSRGLNFSDSVPIGERKIQKITHKGVPGALGEGVFLVNDNGEEDCIMNTSTMSLVHDDRIIILTCAAMGPFDRREDIEKRHAKDLEPICRRYFDSFTLLQ